MGWSIGYDPTWNRDIGYGVPAICDHPDCNEEIDRGLGYVCGNAPYGGDSHCGLYFCPRHGGGTSCERCDEGLEPFEPKPDTAEWIAFKLSDESWATWRQQCPAEVAEAKQVLKAHMKAS